MAKIEVQLPSLLVPIVEGRARFTISADTLRGALDELTRAEPRLAVHLFDESGSLRQHVLCFHNGKNTRWLDNLDGPTRDGDTLLFMQAVSGG